MLLQRYLAPFVSFAGLASAVPYTLAARDDCPAEQSVTKIYSQTVVFVYPVVIDQYCPSTTVLTLDAGVTFEVTNAPTHITTTVFATGTSSFATTV